MVLSRFVVYGKGMKERIIQRITDSAFWRSIFRTGMPDTDLKRSLLIYNNFFLHIFPAKIKRHGLKFAYTFCLGGISCLLLFHSALPFGNKILGRCRRIRHKEYISSDRRW